MIKILFIICSIKKIDFNKDTTYLIMESAKRKKWAIYYISDNDISIENSIVFCNASKLTIKDTYYLLSSKFKININNFDIIIMRKDPPFNIMFLYITYFLEKIGKKGTVIYNNPIQLRNKNEKLLVMNYYSFSPKTLVSCKYKNICFFIKKYKNIIVKPINKMGGELIFKIKKNDLNKNVILETLTKNESEYIIIQKYCQNIKYGDKRILIINGKPLKFLTSRIPLKYDIRGNISKGALSTIRKLHNYEYKISYLIGKDLNKKKIIIIGIDIINIYLTEINITSPTMARQIHNKSKINTGELILNNVF